MGRPKKPDSNPTDYKAFYTMAAKQAGLSLNEFIIAAIEEKMERDSPDTYKQMQEETKN